MKRLLNSTLFGLLLLCLWVYACYKTLATLTQ